MEFWEGVGTGSLRQALQARPPAAGCDEWYLLAQDNVAHLSLNADSSAPLSRQLVSFQSAELGALFAISLPPNMDQLC